MSLKNETSRTPNPYALALATATLAGVLAIVGGYYGAKFQGSEALLQKQMEFRVKAYESFLESDRNRLPSLHRLLLLGASMDRLKTDTEIQTFEAQAATLLKVVEAQDQVAKLDSECNLLRLHSSSRVIRICEDFISAWLGQDDEIRWKEYPTEVQALWKKWRPSDPPQPHIDYGYEAVLSDDDRWRIELFSKLRIVLLDRLRTETQLQ